MERGDDGVLRPVPPATPAYVELRDLLADMPGVLLIVDNASDTFSGNEIKRTEVRAFVRGLRALVRKQGGAVLLLAHIDKNAARGFGGGETYSGSTAWHNSARSRLVLKPDKDGAMTLEHEKSNFGRKREPLRLVWADGGLPMLDGPASGFVQSIADRSDTKALLRLIHEFTQRGEYVSTATSGPAALTQALRDAPGYPRKLRSGEVFELVRQAERSGWIERVNYVNAARKPRERWNVTLKGCEAAGIEPAAPVAPVAPVPGIGATVEPAHRPAPVAPVPGARGVGGSEGAQNRHETGAQATP
jgi:hypothetical protein